MIRISEILDASRIFMDLKGHTKQQALQEMTVRLAEQGIVHDHRAVYELLIEREQLMTTGVKRGFAFPHAFSNQFQRSFLSMGCSRDGIEYQSLDGHPVHFVFLLLGPTHHQTIHLRILARVSRLMGQQDMYATLREAGSSEEVMSIMNSAERQLTSYHYNASEV